MFRFVGVDTRKHTHNAGRYILSGLSDEERSKRAERERTKGNESYRAGDLDEALAYYSRSVQLWPSVEALNNRALAYVKLGRFADATLDCDRVLGLTAPPEPFAQPDNLKALLRKASAFKGRLS